MPDAAPLLPTLRAPTPRPALRVRGRALTHQGLADRVAGLVPALAGAGRVAVWAEPELEACVALVAALAAGVPAVPVNPRAGERELAHVVGDSAPDLVLARPGAVLPAAVAALPRVDVDLLAGSAPLPPEPDPSVTALVVYTSGTTGPPKGAVLSRRAVAANLDALATAWDWTGEDVVVHALPLFHVHGLVLGLLGPLRRGGAVHHLGAFSADTVAAVAAELAGPATVLFGVPTTYHRLADAAERDPSVATALAGARLLVSGSAPLPAADADRIAAATGRRVVERYGLTETLIVTGVRAGGDPRPGRVGPPLDGVAVRLVDDVGGVLDAWDDETVGEVEVCGPSLFDGYLGRPDATAAAVRTGPDGARWFRTGDVATRAADGSLRLLGRRATDLVKSGGYKIGAGEVESALLEHPGVAEAAVTGEPDADLGERVVAWVVPAVQPPPGLDELAAHVAALLAPHKRPRVLHVLDTLPRTELGKVRKTALRAPR